MMPKSLLFMGLLVVGLPGGAVPLHAEPAVVDPVAVLPLRFGTVDLSTGIRMHFAEQGEPGPEPTLVFLHGWGDSWFSWSRILPLLPPARHAVALDLRGYGATSAPEGSYAPATMAGDVAAFLEARGIARAVLVGHSMGGFVAQEAVALVPDRVAGLVLVGTATHPASFPGMADLAAELASLESMTEQMARAFQEGTVRRPVPAAFMDEVVAVSVRVPMHVWARTGADLLAMAPVPAVADYTGPALILWGVHDPMFPRSEQDALHALLERSRLEVFPEAAHAPHWEEPERVVELLVEWERDS